MTKVLLLGFLFFPFHVKGQKLNICQVLETVLQYKPAIKAYYFDKNTSYPIIFYDTTGIFRACSLSVYHNRETKVFNELPDSNTLVSDYIIVSAKKMRRTLRFTLSYKSSGAYCDFVLKKKRKKYKVIKFRERYL